MNLTLVKVKLGGSLSSLRFNEFTFEIKNSLVKMIIGTTSNTCLSRMLTLEGNKASTVGIQSFPS